MRESNIVSRIKKAIVRYNIRRKMWNDAVRGMNRAYGYTDISRKTIKMWRKKIKEEHNG